jgi:biopolymer transport protein ExbB
MLEWFQKGGPTMWPLLLCSVISLAFVIERFFFWFLEMGSADPAEVDRLLELLRRGHLKDFLKEAQGSKNPIVKTLERSLAHGTATLSEALSVEIDRAVERTRRSLGVIDTCVTLAPLLGIFGTVTGIIKSFELLGHRAVGMADPQGVTAGIAEALITTEAGLLIAMPSLVFLNFFAARSDRFTFRLEHYAREFEILASRLQGKPGGKAEPAEWGRG